jgi:hypothetical protein
VVKEGIEGGLSSQQTRGWRGRRRPPSRIVGHQGTGFFTGEIEMVIRIESPARSPGQRSKARLLGQALFEGLLLAMTRTITISFPYGRTAGNGASLSFPDETVGIPATIIHCGSGCSGLVMIEGSHAHWSGGS